MEIQSRLNLSFNAIGVGYRATIQYAEATKVMIVAI